MRERRANCGKDQLEARGFESGTGDAGSKGVSLEKRGLCLLAKMQHYLSTAVGSKSARESVTLAQWQG